MTKTIEKIGKEEKVEARGFSPFLKVATLWFLFGMIFCLFSGRREQMGWFVGIWALVVGNLFALAKASEALLGFAAGRESPKRGGLKLIFWGSLKLLCLGALLCALFFTQEGVESLLIIGMGTAIVVPLLGGVLSYAR